MCLCIKQQNLVFRYSYLIKRTRMLPITLGHKSSIIYTDLASGNTFFAVFVHDLLYSVSLRIDSGQRGNRQTPIVSRQAKIRPPVVWVPEDKMLFPFPENSSVLLKYRVSLSSKLLPHHACVVGWQAKRYLYKSDLANIFIDIFCFISWIVT